MSSVVNQPENLNNATMNNFRFGIQGLPTFEYFVTDVNLPSLTMGEAVQANPLIDRPLPGDKITYGEVSIEFLVDEEFRNWQEIHDWMISLGSPKSLDQYKSNEVYKDATLTLLTNSMNPMMEITFIDMFPTSLGDLQFGSAGAADSLIGSASFRFRAYDIRRI